MNISQYDIQQMLNYDPSTGHLTWRVKRPHVQAGDIAGYVNAAGRQIGIDGRSYQADKIAWYHTHGEWPNKLQHIDGNKLNNALNNLKLQPPKNSPSQ